MPVAMNVQLVSTSEAPFKTVVIALVGLFFIVHALALLAITLRPDVQAAFRPVPKAGMITQGRRICPAGIFAMGTANITVGTLASINGLLDIRAAKVLVAGVPDWGNAEKVYAILMIAVGFMSVFAGISLIRMRKGAPTLNAACAGSAIVLHFFYVAYMLAWVVPATRLGHGPTRIGNSSGAIGVACIYMAHAGLLLLVLALPSVRAAFKAPAHFPEVLPVAEEVGFEGWRG